MNSNCNENNEQYYLEFEKVLRQIFDKNSYKDVEYIPEVIKQMGYEIIYEDCKRAGYNGDLYLLYKKDNKLYLFESGYGSCCVCDTWYETDESVDNFMSVFKDEDRSTTEFESKEELKEFVKDRWFFDDDFENFIKTYCEEN